MNSIARKGQEYQPEPIVQANEDVTHVLVVYKSQNSSLLFRAKDGILICMQQKAVVVFGDSPSKKDSHTFIDNMAAASWIKTVYPARDIKLNDGEELPILEERDGESHGLYMPDDSLELPGMGPNMRRTN
jgi:hypothetical protein